MVTEHRPLDAAEVLIETVETDGSGGRQIGARERIAELLADRRADIQHAIVQAAEVVRGSTAALDQDGAWQVETIQAKFGVKLVAQAGVVLTRASSEASLEVTVTVSRTRRDE